MYSELVLKCPPLFFNYALSVVLYRPRSRRTVKWQTVDIAIGLVAVACHLPSWPSGQYV